MMKRNKMMAQLGQTIHDEWKKEIRVDWELSRCIPRKNRVRRVRAIVPKIIKEVREPKVGTPRKREVHSKAPT